MPERKVVRKYEPVETKAEFTGMEPSRCTCARSAVTRDRTAMTW